MLQWTKAKYKAEERDSKALIDTLSPVPCDRKGYNVYKTGGGWYLNIFSNQAELRQLVADNQHSVFALNLVNVNDIKHHYRVQLGDGQWVEAKTLAMAAVIIPGTEDDPRSLTLEGDDIIVG